MILEWVKLNEQHKIDDDLEYPWMNEAIDKLVWMESIDKARGWIPFQRDFDFQMTAIINYLEACEAKED